MARIPSPLCRAALSAIAILSAGAPAQTAPIGIAAPPGIVAVRGIVTGNVQKVGFRAMVMKQAIKHNLAGTARNHPDSSVEFTLQGRPGRIDKALETIRDGTRTSSDVKVATEPTAVDPALGTFTVFDWTSTSRNITQPYTLVFTVRSVDETIPMAQARNAWHAILRTTLADDDLRKLGPDD
ncbi:acylphosphatase [Ancylobacter sp. 6x-1]|uniref:acylphosphatase n=1 Tax=Ancylobacter crimeensis TaxID=2579147 RepID=A0ABT0DCB9_9HYPH|nr:acylphosphatase [Ancylobacter crimeensis]MCK0197616.1 acylphosphatase [Ancylobacter crimeensis]